ncbi:MAG TPA: hypothetical protein VMS83_08985 [Methanoregula sp.]|nr:hypothetical protein [Methanoregula sp.]
MKTSLPVKIAGIVLLFAVLVPAGQAVTPLWIFNATPGEALSTVAISDSGSIIVAGGDQLVGISPQGQKLWAGWSGSPVDISGDGEYIVAAQDQFVCLISGQGVLLWQHPAGGEAVTAVSITPDGAIVAAGAGYVVQTWYNSGTGMGTNTTDLVQDVKVSPVKDQVLVSTAKALETFNLTFVPNWQDTSLSPTAIAISGDGTGIVAANGNRVRMYHGSGTLLWDQGFPGGNIISLAYSRDGSTIVAGRDDGSVLAISRAGSLLWTGNAGVWATSVAVSDDGSTIATGSIDNRIHIYNRQGTLLGEAITKNPVKSRSVAVSGDGNLIVAVDSSGVYGFSRSQFTAPAGAPAASPSATPTPLPPTEATPAPTALTVTVPVVTTGSVPSPSASPAPGFSGALVPAALAILILAGKGRNG